MSEELNQLRRELAGRYEVEQELGHGGMAVVYLAKDLRHDRRVAIKVLRQDVGGASAERFLREIRTVAQLHHPHLLPLHDSGTAGDHLFYVMPYVEGETIRQRLEREGPRRIPGPKNGGLDWDERRQAARWSSCSRYVAT